jgi:hypothetical protein
MLRRMSRSFAFKLCVTTQALLAGAATLGGCAYGEMTQVLRSQVATETKCPSLVVKKASAYAAGYQPNQYTVRGCDIERVYTCKGDEGLVAFGSTDCVYQSGPAAGKPAAEPAPAAPGTDDVGADDDLSSG